MPDILISFSYGKSQITKYQINNNNFNFSTYVLNELVFIPIISELNNEFPNDLILFRNPTPQVYLYENTGDASFVFKGIHNTLNTYGVIFTNAKDYNQDGYDDFSYVQCNWADCTDSLYIELNDQNWSYEPAQQYYIGPISSLKVNSIDLNNDNFPDFYITGYDTDAKIKILWNNGDGTFSYLNPVSVRESKINPDRYLFVSPNPFTRQTSIEFFNNANGAITIIISDLLGNLIYSKFGNQILGAGKNIFTWDGTDNSGNRCSPGAYILWLEINGIRYSTKIFLY